MNETQAFDDRIRNKKYLSGKLAENRVSNCAIYTHSVQAEGCPSANTRVLFETDSHVTFLLLCSLIISVSSCMA